MNSEIKVQPPKWPLAAWLSVVLAGVAAPLAALAVLDISDAVPLAMTLALMGAGMIGAAASGRLWIGVSLAVLIGLALIAGASAFSSGAALSALVMVPAIVIAAFSFAARGALFARSMPGLGWCMAVFVVMGEAAIILTAFAMPGILPDWLLVLLPAQWTNAAIQSALAQTSPAAMGISGAAPALIALAGTAATTLFAAEMLPRKWPYLIMFSAWLSASALVWYWPRLIAA